MEPSERRQLILDELNENGKVDIDELAGRASVSSMTIRRDLTILESEGEVIRTHGGAVLKKPLVNESSFHDKESKNHFEKRQIAKEAVTIIQNDSTILLDSGTTTLEIAKLLKHKQNITVITNDIKIAVELMDSDVKVIIAGGELQNSIGALFGPLTENILNAIHVDVFFLGAHAAHIDAGVTAPTHQKASIKKAMLNAAEVTWLVADSSKFNQKSFTKVCDLSEIDALITDDRLAENDKSRLSESLQVVTVRGEVE